MLEQHSHYDNIDNSVHAFSIFVHIVVVLDYAKFFINTSRLIVLWLYGIAGNFGEH